MNIFGNVTVYNSNLISDSVKSNCHDDDSQDFHRIWQSLHRDPDPRSLSEHLSMDDIRQIADFVNYTHLHYSANCTLLAACVHYNIENNSNALRSENISSPYFGLNPDMVDEAIFGRSLSSSFRYFSLEDVDIEVLRRYEINRERSCIITVAGYAVPLIGEVQHEFNAVVLSSPEKQPTVQYVDSWKTSNTMPDREELKRRFSPQAYFTVRSYKGD